MPRTKEEIESTLAAIKSAWLRTPQLSLVQLIINLSQGNDPWYISDDSLMQSSYKWPSER
jgi:hypothetical protein